MRRSGESAALGEDDGASAKEKDREEALGSGEPSTPARAHSAWLIKVEKPRRRVTAPPPHLSQRT